MNKQNKRFVAGAIAALTIFIGGAGSAGAAVSPKDRAPSCKTYSVSERLVEVCTEQLPGSDGSKGDFDGDNKADEFRVVKDPASSNNLFQIRYSGSTTWTTVNKSNVVLSQVRFADFDGDNKDDVFVKWPSGKWGYLSAGKGNWNLLSNSKNSIASLRFKDMDGDGKADVLREHQGYVQYVPTKKGESGQWVNHHKLEQKIKLDGVPLN